MALEFSVLSLLLTLLPLFALAFLGAWFRSKRYMDERADATLFWLVVNFFYALPDC